MGYTSVNTLQQGCAVVSLDLPLLYPVGWFILSCTIAYATHTVLAMMAERARAQKEHAEAYGMMMRAMVPLITELISRYLNTTRPQPPGTDAEDAFARIFRMSRAYGATPAAAPTGADPEAAPTNPPAPGLAVFNVTPDSAAPVVNTDSPATEEVGTREPGTWAIVGDSEGSPQRTE